MILLMQQQGAVIATFEDAYGFVKDPGGLFYITYLNVVVLTIFDVVLFGIAIYRMKPGLSKATGLLLILNALACFLGIIGIIMGNQILAYGSAIGGGLFFLSLIGMSILFWRD